MILGSKSSLEMLKLSCDQLQTKYPGVTPATSTDNKHGKQPQIQHLTKNKAMTSNHLLFVWCNNTDSV